MSNPEIGPRFGAGIRIVTQLPPGHRYVRIKPMELERIILPANQAGPKFSYCFRNTDNKADLHVFRNCMQCSEREIFVFPVYVDSDMTNRPTQYTTETSIGEEGYEVARRC
ncbi:hypothetical protein GCM10009625_31720 [Brachybacterium fresconis]|uniref:Uncharacterized protein n=1 Tax=Brevibacterium picturae TaxID=260553 RepID=A0ABN2C4V4_9MICO